METTTTAKPTSKRNFVCRVYYTSQGGKERYTDSIRMTAMAARREADRYGHMGHSAAVVPAPDDAAEVVDLMDPKDVRVAWRGAWKGAPAEATAEAAPLADAEEAAREWAAEPPTRTDAAAVLPMAAMAETDRAERAAQPAPVIVRPSPRIAKMARQVDAPAFLAAMNMEVVTGVVSAFLAIREAYAAREAKEWAAELSRATRAAQAASAPAKRSALKCTRCRKPTDKCYVNGATIWCVKCRAEVSGITKTAESGKAWAV
jgi:hypothetical protein